MSVRLVTDTSVPASPLDNVRCYDLYVDGQIYSANGNSGTFLIGTVGLTGAYANDSYTVSLPNCSYTKFAYMVNLELKSFIHTVVSSGGTFTISTLPASIRPATAQRYLITGSDNGSILVCTIIVGTNGVITLYSGLNLGNFSAGVGGLPATTSITYTVN